METKDNGQKNAFPCDGQYAGEARANNDSGLTKRELISAMVLQGMCSGRTIYESPGANVDEAIKLTDLLLEKISEGINN